MSKPKHARDTISARARVDNARAAVAAQKVAAPMSDAERIEMLPANYVAVPRDLATYVDHLMKEAEKIATQLGALHGTAAVIVDHNGGINPDEAADVFGRAFGNLDNLSKSIDLLRYARTLRSGSGNLRKAMNGEPRDRGADLPL